MDIIEELEKGFLEQIERCKSRGLNFDESLISTCRLFHRAGASHYQDIAQRRGVKILEFE